MSKATNPATGAQGSDNITVRQLIDDLSEIQERIENVDESNVESMTDLTLVELRSELKGLEDSVEEARKSVVDSEVKDRVDVGDDLLGLSHIESHNKYVKEDIQSVIMRAVQQEIDYTQFVKIDAPTLASDFPELAEIGKAEYAYLR